MYKGLGKIMSEVRIVQHWEGMPGTKYISVLKKIISSISQNK